jgi:Bacterial SH3 domain
MNRVLLSLCLLGAALATANTLFIQGPGCRSVANEIPDLGSARNIAPPPGKSFTLPDAAAKNPASAASSQDITGAIRANATTPKALSAKPSRIENHVSEWAEVTVAVKVRSGPSISAPVIRYYRAGAKLQVLERQTDWTKIVDPATLKDGWIYARYLSPRDEPSQAQADLRQEPPFVDPRRHGWRWYGAQQRPRFRIVFGVHPRW